MFKQSLILSRIMSPSEMFSSAGNNSKKFWTEMYKQIGECLQYRQLSSVLVSLQFSRSFCSWPYVQLHHQVSWLNLYQESQAFPRNLTTGLCFYLMTAQKEVRREDWKKKVGQLIKSACWQLPSQCQLWKWSPRSRCLLIKKGDKEKGD